jgi:curli biogenesis system outer membrane secretion channel CsgG
MTSRTMRIVAVLAVVAIFAIYLGRRGSRPQRAKDEAGTQLPAPPQASSERPLDRDFKAAMQRESAMESKGSLPSP